MISLIIIFFYVRSRIEFSKLEGICNLSEKMVETKKM
jgi:hypothetical protein